MELEIMVSLLVWLYVVPEAIGNCMSGPLSRSSPAQLCHILVLGASVAKTA